MNAVVQARRATARLFAVYAVVTLIPIVALGFILAADFRSEAQSRGIDQARSEAQLIAQTAIEPLLDGAALSGGLSAADLTGMRRLVRQTVNRKGEGALRLRLRDQTGHIVFSDDGAGLGQPGDDEAVDANRGETVAILTHLNTDAEPATTPAPAPSRSTCPLRARSPVHHVGVLELYLSYAPDQPRGRGVAERRCTGT